MELNNILIIKGGSQYGVLRDFADELAAGFKKNGVNVGIYDALLGDDDISNQAVMGKEYDMVFGFNGMMLGGYKKLVGNPNTLYWNFLVDHPYHHHWTLQVDCNNYMVSCVDNNHVRYIKKYYPNVDHSIFVAHGGNVPKEEVVPFCDREYEVCFMGTVNDLDNFEVQLDSCPELDKNILSITYDLLTAGSHNTMEDIISQLLEHGDIHLSDKTFAEIMSTYSFMDSYARVTNRKKVIEKLLEEEVKVHVFGNGWDKLKMNKKENMIIHGNVPYDEVIKVMSNSKIIINTLPMFRDGSHERVFTSLLCGAVCVTEINEYFPTELKHGEDVVYFDMNDLDSLVTNVKLLLSNNALCEKIVHNGMKRVQECHSWENRAREIINISKEIKGIGHNVYVEENENIDYLFNSLITYIKNSSLRLLVNKAKSSFYTYEIALTEYANKIKCIWTKKGEWDETDTDGNIFFRDRVKNVLSNVDDYVEVYKGLNKESREALYRIIRYKLKFDSQDFNWIVKHSEVSDFFGTIQDII